MPFLSMRQYAASRRERGLPGGTAEAVSKAVKRGRIPTVTDENGDRKIDPEAADRAWAGNSDPTKLRGFAPEKGAEDAPMEVRSPNMATAAAVLKTYQARLSKLDFEERSGKLVYADAVAKKWVAISSTVRSKVMGIPSRARQRIPEMTDDQYAVLETVVRETLEDLADNGGE